jgi:autotransporter-associated beta strand protein
VGTPAVALLNNTGTVVLNAANTFGGGTTLNGGAVLQIGDNAALGTGALNFNGGTIQPDGSGLALLTAAKTLSNAITFASGAGASYAADAYFGGSTDLVLSGAVNLGSTGNRVLNVSSTARVVTLSGVISGAARIDGLRRRLSPTHQRQQQLHRQHASFRRRTAPTTAGALGAGSLIFNGGALGYWDNSGTLSNAITLSAATNTLDVGQAQSLNAHRPHQRVCGECESRHGSGGKSGLGALFLTGNNSYLGTTTINAGVLAISSDSQLGGILVRTSTRRLARSPSTAASFLSPTTSPPTAC